MNGKFTGKVLDWGVELTKNNNLRVVINFKIINIPSYASDGTDEETATFSGFLSTEKSENRVKQMMKACGAKTEEVSDLANSEDVNFLNKDLKIELEIEQITLENGATFNSVKYALNNDYPERKKLSKKEVLDFLNKKKVGASKIPSKNVLDDFPF